MEWIFWALGIVCGGLFLFMVDVARGIWWKPLQVKKCFECQGIRGPPYRLFYGNTRDIERIRKEESSKPMPVLSHDIVPKVFPHYHRWTKAYGQDFIYWSGCRARLNVPHPELIKDIMLNKFGHYEKILSNNPLARQLAEQGLVGLRGEKWVQHRRIINLAFRMELLKGMIPTMMKSSSNMLEKWSKLVMSGASEIEVLNEFRNLTADVIARTAFGSSYADGEHIFNMQAKQMVLACELFGSVYIPGFRFLPTKKNRQRWHLEKEIRRSLRQIVESRKNTAAIEKSGCYGTDLLGLMMSANKEDVGGNLKGNTSMTVEEIIDECKTFYFTGHETSSVLLTWTMILLGIHQDWQERARREVLEVCGKYIYPNGDSISCLKTVEMILNETLRLYPPALFLTRQTYKPMKLGKLSIPAETELMIPIVAIHHDPILWGNDVKDFNPERFSEGIAKAAKHPMAFMPFGLGPTICPGQNFALLEVKVALAMILQRFSFVISPSYTHSPIQLPILQPQYGAQIILHMG